MAYWGRIRQATVKSLSIPSKRCHLLNQTTTHPITRVLQRPTPFVIQQTQIDFGSTVRFFAAPVQAKLKEEDEDADGRRLNEKITAEVVRVVTEDGHDVMSRREALERARSLKLDLVEVQRNATPPVCKIMDYRKEMYKKQAMDKERMKSKSEGSLRKGANKEVRFSVKIEQKDLQMKADSVKRLMDRGYRVKCMVMGNEDQDLGGMLSRLNALIEDVSLVESGPRVGKQAAYILVRHKKFGPPKKGSGKFSELIVTGIDDTEVQSENLSEEAETHNPDEKNATWSAFEADDDFDSAFDLEVEAKTGKNTGDTPINPAPNRFSDFSPRTVDPLRKETVLSSSVQPSNNNILPKPSDGKGTSFGIFSASKGNYSSDGNGPPQEVNNRYNKGNSSDSRRYPPPRRVSESPRTPLSDTNRYGRQGVDSGEQGKSGIFSRESSNRVPSRNTESDPRYRRQ